jgi:8-oxo-dGTP pyrophosphatase MutT (NUDIX family)
MKDDWMKWVTKNKIDRSNYGIFYASREVRTNQDGAQGTFTLIEAPRWVTVIPVVVENGKRSFLMVRQFRHGSSSLTTEFPAGTIEEGEDSAQAGLRELEEETGMTGVLSYLGSVNPNPAFMTNEVVFYLAQNLVPRPGRSQDEHERIELVTHAEDFVLSTMGSGEFSNGIMCIAAWFYQKGIKNVL